MNGIWTQLKSAAAVVCRYSAENNSGSTLVLNQQVCEEANRQQDASY